MSINFPERNAIIKHVNPIGDILWELSGEDRVQYVKNVMDYQF